MAFKNFKIQVVIRSILIGLCLFAFVFAIYQDEWYVTSASLFILSVVLVAELIRYVEKTRRDISNFLVSVNLRDFTSVAESESNSASKNKDLIDAFKYIASEFQNVRIEKELHYQYLQNVISHVDTALICFEDKGKIALINQGAKDLLKTNSMQSLEYLKRTQGEIGFLLSNIRGGEHKLLKVSIKGELMQLSVRATEFKLQDAHYKLVALQDIKSELDGKELESWQKLIRVLTHEIMNSVTPITSLSQAIKENLENENGKTLTLKEIEEGDLTDIHDSIVTIENRSKGLLKFVETYKNLTRLPNPKFEEVKITDLLNNVSSLMKAELDKDNITMTIRIQEPDSKIYADQEMIVRVLINLVSNSRDALKNRPNAEIRIEAFIDKHNRQNILIRDNGNGMDRETLDNIFVPFFTTKEKGSGIGLSLCRQILRLHNGTITAESEEGKGTLMSLRI